MSSIQQRPTSHWRVIASPEGGKKWAVSKRKLPMSPSFQKLPSGMDDIEQKYDAYKLRSSFACLRASALDLKVPQVRSVEGGESFYPSALERGIRSERALKLAIAEMYVQGVSTRRVTAITKELCGLEISSSQVSRAAKELDAELEAWRTRTIGRCRYLFLDARYEKVRVNGNVISCSVLIAVGVREDGKRSVLGLSVSLSEAEIHWRNFIQSLQHRGLHGLLLITSDDHAGLKAALNACLPSVKWQRCQFHLQQNARSYVPQMAMRAEVAQTLRNIFNAPDRAESMRQLQLAIERYKSSAPKLANWMEENVPEGLTVFSVPASHRRMLRTSNVLERINKELRRRTRVVSLFPNEASLLRLASALLAETSEEWESGRIYLTLEPE